MIWIDFHHPHDHDHKPDPNGHDVMMMLRTDNNVFPTDGSKAAGNPGGGAPTLGRVQVIILIMIMIMMMLTMVRVFRKNPNEKNRK